MIRHLFIKSDLIHENDGLDRLIFFTTLESTWIQRDADEMRNIDMKLGN